MITATKTFDDYLNLPLLTMKGNNFITMIEVDDDMRLGLYYLMEVYHLGFVHVVRASWEWISIVKEEHGDYLTSTQILAMERDEEAYNRLKDEFNRGIRPAGSKGKPDANEELEKTEFKFTGEFGWLSPTGDFTVSDWGRHEGDAYDIIEDKGFIDEYDEWDGDGVLRLARDFLCIVKGYVLIHNPSNDGGYIITHTKPMTKKQKEFLYDYFMALNNPMRASHYFED